MISLEIFSKHRISNSCLSYDNANHDFAINSKNILSPIALLPIKVAKLKQYTKT